MTAADSGSWPRYQALRQELEEIEGRINYLMGADHLRNEPWEIKLASVLAAEAPELGCELVELLRDVMIAAERQGDDPDRPALALVLLIGRARAA